jgi:hypothetical protein
MANYIRIIVSIIFVVLIASDRALKVSRAPKILITLLLLKRPEAWKPILSIRYINFR